MKLKDNFITYEEDGEHLTIPTGGSAWNGLIRSNKTAGFIVECLKEDTTEDAIIEKMLEKYDAPREMIASDVAKILAKLRSVGALDE